MKIVISFLFGLLFGAGLIVSGMTSPARVIGFLDIAGNWDPSLAFVMGGAIFAATPLYALAKRRGRPLAGEQLDTPDTQIIDHRLVGGAAVFGIGWGISGICPGPALVDLAIAPTQATVFVLAMTVGLVGSRSFGKANTGERLSTSATVEALS